MLELARLQHEFANHLRTGSATVAEHVVATARVDTATRLGIYAEAYRLRLLEALHTDYPGLCEAMGIEAFDTMGSAYIAAYPSQYYSLRHFGGDLGRFLRDTLTYADRPWLAELADFEWALAAVFDAADSVPYTLGAANALDSQAWPSMCLRFQPTVRRMDLIWNVAPYWQAVSDHQTSPAWNKSDTAVPWLLWRKNLRVYFRSLDPIEARALDLAYAGEDFSALCVGLCELLPEHEVPLRVASLFRAWIEQDMLSGVEVT